MSDEQVNERVSIVVEYKPSAVELGVSDMISKMQASGNPELLMASDGMRVNPFPDYCNNPSDAWPIIVENGIGINKTLTRSRKEKGTWYADRGIGVELTFNDNPLRAAMICFLKIKDAAA